MKRLIVASLCSLLWCGSAWALQICVPTVPASTPTSQFVDHGNGTLTDTKTGLMWKACSEGLSGAVCAIGAATSNTWQGALQAAQTLNAGGGFAGFTDWRLPNQKELQSIVERQCQGPSINATIFPATVTGFYWSASPYAVNATSVRGVEFNYGNDGGGTGAMYPKNSFNYVRLVRGGQ